MSDYSRKRILMQSLKLPLAKPQPDYREFMKAVTTSYEPRRTRLVEYLVNPPIQKEIMALLNRPWVEIQNPFRPVAGAPKDDIASVKAYYDNYIAMWYHLGYDFVRLELGMNFPKFVRAGGDHGRTYSETARGPIQSWEDFEKYPWPNPSEADFFPYEYVSKNLPEGMGMICCHAAGPLEWIDMLMGYEFLCIALYEQPDLIKAVADKVESLVTQYIDRLLQLPGMIAYWQGDDMGFRTGTLIGPDHLRQYVLPTHKRYAAKAHAKGIAYFLHSCGQIHDVMGDLIDDVKIDAKHSVEDAINPVQEWKKRYGGRIGILGGVDLDKLTRSTPDDVRKYVRKIIDDCQPGGHFALGSGNSIPDYIPVENYLTMLDEAFR